MVDIKLKPCPFCGCGEAATEWHHGYWSVKCGYAHDGTPSNHCFQDWGEFETEEEAIESWNRRADDHPERHGHWISCHDIRGISYLCSNCKCGKSDTDTEHYCHYCGAKMDEEDNHG